MPGTVNPLLPTYGQNPVIAGSLPGALPGAPPPPNAQRDALAQMMAQSKVPMGPQGMTGMPMGSPAGTTFMPPGRSPMGGA